MHNLSLPLYVLDLVQREKDANELLRDFLPKFLQPLEEILKKRGGQWYAGSEATFADLVRALSIHSDQYGLHGPSPHSTGTPRRP